MTINEMDNFETPPKKMKFDDFVSEWDDDDDDDLAANDDIWQQGEITAEQFDMLEMQATQKLQNDTTFNLHAPSTSACIRPDEEWKKQQYALEGKIKLLNESLEKTVRELNKERFDKDRIISQKEEEFQKQQKNLKKEIEKLQTCLQFKDQEMKYTQGKIFTLEQKLETTKKSVALTASQQVTCNAKPVKPFLNKFDFEKNERKLVESSVQTIDNRPLKKNYQLSLISPRGEPKGGEILSSLLVSQNQDTIINRLSPQRRPSVKRIDGAQHLSIALARLNANQGIDGIWDFYDDTLKHHLSFLQNRMITNQKSGTVTLSKAPVTRNAGRSFVTGTHMPFYGTNIESYHSLVSQCLKDLNKLLVWCTPQVKSRQDTNPLEQYEQILKRQVEQDISMCSAPLFTMVDTSSPEPLCLLSLLTLAKKETYPESYQYKKDELLLALRALSSWSSQSAASMVPHVYQLPLQQLTSGQQDIPCALLALQLVTNLVGQKDFSALIHQSDGCIFTFIAGLCHIVSNATKEDCASLLHLVEGFLCSSVAILGPAILQDEKCQCSPQIVQGFILMLWHHFQLYNNDLFPSGEKTLKKGLLTLYQLFSHVKNFKEKRVPVENYYILLICGLSKFTRENSQLKYLNDTVRELWDFQSEGGEFESDESTSSQMELFTIHENGNS